MKRDGRPQPGRKRIAVLNGPPPANRQSTSPSRCASKQRFAHDRDQPDGPLDWSRSGCLLGEARVSVRLLRPPSRRGPVSMSARGTLDPCACPLKSGGGPSRLLSLSSRRAYLSPLSRRMSYSAVITCAGATPVSDCREHRGCVRVRAIGWMGQVRIVNRRHVGAIEAVSLAELGD